MTEQRDNADIAHTSGQFNGKHDTKIFYQEWAPNSGEPRAVLLVVHGYAEHSGRYEALAHDLVSAGFAVCTIDHRGHGKSEGKRVQVDKFDDMVEDLASYEQELRERYPAPLPVFLIGHSMGGLISLRYATTQKTDVVGLVLTGTAAAKPADISGLTIAIGRVLAKVAPDVGVASLHLDKISRDPKVVEAYENDPLVTISKVRARMGSELIDTMDAVEKDLPSLTLPILVMHGGDDVVTPPDASRMIADKVGSEDKTLKIWDGLFHEVYNEPERDEVIADVVAWLDDAIAKA